MKVINGKGDSDEQEEIVYQEKYDDEVECFADFCGTNITHAEKIWIAGKSFGLLSIPFYLAPRVLEDW